MINEKELNTEEKIKAAARKIFQQKGFAGARTRDIAEEAGINLALLNYYYRSKEKLFELVMQDSMKEILSIITAEANNPDSSLDEKIETVVGTYFEALTKNPNILLFVLGELKNNPRELHKTIGIPKNFLRSTVFYRQVKEALEKSGAQDIDPDQIFLNMFSLSIFPFLGRPLFEIAAGMEGNEYDELMKKRKNLLPAWIKATMIG